MGRLVRFIYVLILVCLTIGLAKGQTTNGPHKAEPSTFYPDDELKGFEDAQPPSDPVLDALLKTPEAQENSDRLQRLDREKLRGLFLVVKIHLRNSVETDEVVLGKFPMTGADCDWFWIVRDMGDHAKVLLFDNAYGVYLLRSRTNGYREIASYWSSAAGYSITRLYRYDGTSYKLAYEHTRPERQPTAKR